MSEPPLQHHPQKEMSFPEEKWLFLSGVKKVRRNMIEKKPRGLLMVNLLLRLSEVEMKNEAEN